MSTAPVSGRNWERLGPSLFVLAVVTASAMLFAGTTYLVGKRREDQKRFFKNFRPPNYFEANLVSKIDYAVNSSEKNDVIFLGDSTCLSDIQTVEFERLSGLKAYNLGCMGILGVDGCEMLLRSYLGHHPKPRMLVFSAHPLMLTSRPSDLGPAEIRARFFWSFGPEGLAIRPPHDHAVRYFIQQGLQTLIGHVMGGFARYAAEPIPVGGGLSFVTLVKEMRETRGHWAHPGALDAATRRKGCGLEAVDRRLNISPDHPFPVSEENRHWFRALACYAREQEIALLIRLTPVLLGASAERYDSIHAWTTELREEFPGVIISRPEVIQYEPGDFWETSHLNPQGAAKFTALAAQEVMKVWQPGDESGHDH